MRLRAGIDAADRIAGIDLARGVAIIGMFAAHLLTIRPFDGARPETWLDVANGRSSILFATLAGVSLGLMSGGAEPVRGARLRATSARIALRAAVLWPLGIALALTRVPIYVILPAYALLFLLALPVLALPARLLFPLATVVAVATPFAFAAVEKWPLWQSPAAGVIELLTGWHYPFLVWIAFLYAGLGAARAGLRRPRTQVWLLGGGAVIAVLGYSLAAVFDPDGAAPVLSADAHSTGLAEVIGSGGFALAVTGGCLIVCRSRAVRRVLLPLRAVGSMPLTAYTGQVVVWAVVGVVVIGDVGDLLAARALGLFWWLTLGMLLACTVWAVWVGRGPLEKVLDLLTTRLVPLPTAPAGRIAP